MLTDDGQKHTNPKIYLIESGTCKVQRKFDLEIRNPCNNAEIIHKERHWITLCVVGPGTLIGDETLLYPNRKEQYDYRTVVTSKKLTVLSTSKQVFIKLEPTIEAQVKKFYETKKGQRDEVYNRICKELSTQREKETFNPFFNKHAHLTQMMNKKAVNVFKERESRAVGPSSATKISIMQLNWSQETQRELERSISPIDPPANNQTMSYSRPTSALNRTSKMRFRLERPESALSRETTDRQASSSRDAKSTTNLKASPTVTSFNAILSSLPITGQRTRPTTAAIAERGSLLLKFENEKIFVDESLSDEDQRIEPVQNRETYVARKVNDTSRELTDRSPLERRFQEFLVNEPMDFDIQKRKTMDPYSAKETLQTRKAATQANNASYNKGKAVRVDADVDLKDPLLQHFRTTNTDVVRNNYFENIKTPKAHNAADINHFRFNFSAEDDMRVKRNAIVKGFTIETTSTQDPDSPIKVAKAPEKKDKSTEQQPVSKNTLRIKRPNTPFYIEPFNSQSQTSLVIHNLSSPKITAVRTHSSENQKLGYLNTSSPSHQTGLLARNAYYGYSPTSFTTMKVVKSREELLKLEQKKNIENFKNKIREITQGTRGQTATSRERTPQSKKLTNNRSFNKIRTLVSAQKTHSTLITKGTKSTTSLLL